MSESLLKILIPVFSALVAVILTAFKDEILNFIFRSRKFNYMKGIWGCKWDENPSKLTPAGKQFFDNVEIKSVNGRFIKGSGIAKDAGEWTFKGVISESVVTLTYKVKRGKDKSGTLILKIDEDNDTTLEGVWCQHRRGEIVIGTTVWQKNK